MLSSQPKEHFIKFSEFYNNNKTEMSKPKMSKPKMSKPKMSNPKMSKPNKIRPIIIIWEHMLPQVLDKLLQTTFKQKLRRI
jgi:hypothetical protein